MDRHAAIKFLPFIKAFTEGQIIEFSEDGTTWSETNDPSWLPDYKYRIQPAKPEYKIIIYQDGTLHLLIRNFGQQSTSIATLDYVAQDVLDGTAKELTPWLPFNNT